MNDLTVALAAAQGSVSPRYTLSVRAGGRSTAWGTPGTAWQATAAFPGALAGWNNQSIATGAAPLDGGVLRAFLSWKQGALVCQFVAGGELGSALAWTGNSVVSVTSFAAGAGIDTPRPALVVAGTAAHLYYLLPDGNIYQRASSDGGATWGSAATVYGGGDAVGDVSACHLSAADVHLVHFSTATGGLHLRGASRQGSGAWSVWPVHGDGTGWCAAGIVESGPLTATLVAWSRTTDPYAHHLGALNCTVTNAGALAARDAAVATVWLVSGDAAIRPTCHAVGRGLGGWLHTCQEQSAGRAYLCVGNVRGSLCRIEEPAPVTATPLPAAPLECHFAPLEVGAQTLLVGLTAVYSSAHLSSGGPDDVTVDGDAVIAYTYKVRAGAGGNLELHAAPGTALDAVRPGWGLWLTRRCTKGGNTGAVTLGLRVVRVERHARGVHIEALDALGLLAATLARRPLQFAPDAFSCADAAARLAAWAGLGASITGVTGGAPLMQWSGGEDGLHALRALLRAHAVAVGSRCAAGAAPEIRIAERDEDAQAAFGWGGHPIFDHVQVEDARAARLVVVHGLAVRGAPEEGEEWSLGAATMADPMVRAMPLYVLNRNLDSAAQAAHAAARLAEIAHAQPAGWFDMQAHLALEPGECIEVEGETVYVQQIAEQWERRRLVQQVVYGR